MIARQSFIIALLITAISLAVGSSGCRRSVSPQDALAQANETNIQRMANLYFTFQSKHDWVGPADEAQLKQFIKTYNPDKLKRIGVDPAETDKLFVSDRDGQPFKIRYGVRGSIMGSTEPVVFEATGVDGKRLVGFLNMTSREVEGAEYDDLFAGKIKAEAPTRR